MAALTSFDSAEKAELALPQTTTTTSDDSSTSTLKATLSLSRGRKAALLGLFCLSMFIDVLGSSAFMLFASPISQDLGILFEQQTWIITAYSVTLGSFLLFWGRICDLFSAKPVFTYGFLFYGIASLAISFVNDQHAFFVVRALTGVAGSCLVPAAYRLIAYSFPPEERALAYTLYGMTGSIANVSGTIIAGLFQLVPRGGQMAGWRWLFRIVSIVTISASVGAYLFIPKDQGNSRADASGRDKLRAMDIPGCVLMLSAQVLFIVGLTFGASYGWTTASFLAPFIIGLLLYPAFFFWERKQDEQNALLPTSIWRIPNITVLIIFALLSLGWWGCNFLPFIEMSHLVHHEPIIISAVRTLPEGIAGATASLVMIKYPSLIRNPRKPIIISMLCCITAYAVWVNAPSTVGADYWSWILPAMLFGSGGMQVVLMATNVGVMLAAPAGREGVLGATLQTSQQTSTVVALSVQAGLMTTHPGGVQNWKNVQTSWYFELGWTVLWLIGFVVFYRPSRNLDNKAKAGGDRIDSNSPHSMSEP